MTAPHPPVRTPVRRPHPGRAALAVLLTAVVAMLASAGALAQGAGEEGVRWRELSPAQRGALAPLERDWSTIDAARKEKWLEIAARFPKLPPSEQARVQARMTDWTRMSPAERGQARLNFQQARQVPADDRRSRWEAYQALPAEQRRELAARAVPETRRTAPPQRGARIDAPQPKSNIVPNPVLTAPPRAVAPTTVQAKPGATTTLILERRVPPPHQQTGLPKIAATPDFVDGSTLLPQRGPQGAAVTPARDSKKRRER